MTKKSPEKMRFDPNCCHNEREVESKLIVSYLLPADASQTLEPTTSVVFEAKHPDKNLNDHIDQLKRYMIDLHITYGLLTNGKEIRIYQRTENQIQLIFHCYGYGIENTLT